MLLGPRERSAEWAEEQEIGKGRELALGQNRMGRFGCKLLFVFGLGPKRSACRWSMDSCSWCDADTPLQGPGRLHCVSVALAESVDCGLVPVRRLVSLSGPRLESRRSCVRLHHLAFILTGAVRWSGDRAYASTAFLCPIVSLCRSDTDHAPSPESLAPSMPAESSGRRACLGRSCVPDNIYSAVASKEVEPSAASAMWPYLLSALDGAGDAYNNLPARRGSATNEFGRQVRGNRPECRRLALGSGLLERTEELGRSSRADSECFARYNTLAATVMLTDPADRSPLRESFRFVGAVSGFAVRWRGYRRGVSGGRRFPLVGFPLTFQTSVTPNWFAGDGIETGASPCTPKIQNILPRPNRCRIYRRSRFRLPY